MTQEIIITIGLPGSGKSTHAQQYVDQGYRRINRDEMGGSTSSLDSPYYEAVRTAYAAGVRSFVLDNTYTTLFRRAAVIALGKELGLPVRALWLQVPLEQAQLFASRRQVQRYGKLLKREDYKIAPMCDDPNMFPPGAQFAMRKGFAEPTLAEGFSSIEKIEVRTVWDPLVYKNKAILIDLDGTVRETPDSKAKVKKGCPWPRNPSEVLIIPGCGKVLRRYQEDGYLILAVTNQSGVNRKANDPKYVSDEAVVECIEATEKGLGIKFDDYLYATDRGGPPSTFWRKPCPGMAVVLIERHKLDPDLCTMVGDMKTDQTFATRSGFAFQWAHKFFSRSK